MNKLHLVSGFCVAALAGTVFAQPLVYPIDSSNPTGAGPGGGWTVAMARNDDGSSARIQLPAGFDYCFYGVENTSLFINNNGNITFGAAFGTFTPAGFPVATPMVAPFWADVDTRNTSVGNRPSNQVYYQHFANGAGDLDDVFVVTWDNVGYFNQHNDLRNTFQVALANDPNGFGGFGQQFNTLFSYGAMEWTTGDASLGVGGFGPASTAATVGINEGTGLNRFDQWSRYNNSLVSSLDGTVIRFNGCEGIIPTPGAAAVLVLGGLMAGRRRR